MPGVADIVWRGQPVGSAGVLCVVAHGRGQSPAEMEAEVVSRLSAPASFALPRAADGVWYHARATEPRSAATGAELAASLADIGALVAGAHVPVLLAGFSQGACLALEFAFAGAAGVRAVAALTGCRVGVPGDDRPSRLPARLPVYLTGGCDDPWIPVRAMADAAGELAAAGAALRADVFPARPHEVCAAEIAMLDAMLTDLAAGRAPGMGAAR